MGGVCGAIFGLQDAVKGAAAAAAKPMVPGQGFGAAGGKVPSTAPTSFSFANASVLLRDRSLWRPTLVSTAWSSWHFAAFFATYHVSFKISEMVRDEDDLLNFCVGVGAGIIPVARSKVFRRSAPWAFILVGMDVFSHVANSMGLFEGGKRSSQDGPDSWR